MVNKIGRQSFMKKQSERGNKRVSSDDTGRKRRAMREVANLTNALTAIVMAGGEVLRRDYDFTAEQAADWAEKTIQAAREVIPHKSFNGTIDDT